jgi:hypothetical protein
MCLLAQRVSCVNVALMEVVGQTLVGVQVAEELVQVGGMREERGLGLAGVTSGGPYSVSTESSGSPSRRQAVRGEPSCCIALE